MNATIEVNSEIAKKLLLLAKSKGVSVDELLLVHVPGLNSNGSIATSPNMDKLGEYRAWVNQFSTVGAGLSDEAISRASMYPDR